MLRGNEMLANTFLEDIESIVSARNNHDLINLSDWNPSNKFIQSVNAILLTSVSELLQKNALFADFKAVKEGHVYGTGKNMFQETTGYLNHGYR